MSPDEEVILVHGLWMGPWVMHWMAQQLSQRGYHANPQGIRTLGEGMAQHAARIAAAVEASRASKIHLVGHSLGGVVVLRYLENATSARIGRVVLLGTPARGSEAARQFHRQPWGGMLGASQGIWAAEFPASVNSRFAVGAIAGTHCLGLGAFFVSLPEPNDGVVTLEETKIPGLKDHLALPVSHTGMLFSSQVASQVARFLAFEKFEQ